MKKNKDYLFQVTLVILGLISSVVVLLRTLLKGNSFSKDEYLIINFILVALFILISFIVIGFICSNIIHFTKSSELRKFNKIIEYNKKRKEIEEEINLLTSELINSDLSNYIDINRLAFSGQTNANITDGINYNFFLEQFGIQDKNIETRKNSAIFLTEFTEAGEELFTECQRILGNMNIFLQRTDSYVEKEDIMMNIISLIVKSEIVVVNINGRNPNVYYELGIAHAIGKPTILLSKTNFKNNDIGFDIRQKRIIMYNSIDDLEKQLLYQINSLKRR